MRNARAYVSRWQRNENGGFELEKAANWKDLEDDAIAEVEIKGRVTLSGVYPCSDGLSERTRWAE